MADNFDISTASGNKTLATKDQAGVHHEAALNETLNASGTPQYTSPTNPLPATVDTGTLMQRVEMLELLLNRMLSGAGQQMHDGYGRTRVAIETTPTGGLTVGQAAAAVWAVSVSATASPALYNSAAYEHRNRITVT